MIDIEADDVAVGIKVDDQAFHNLTRFRPGSSRELDVEAVGLRIIMQLHRKNALRTISPAFQDEPDVTQSAKVGTALGIFLVSSTVTFFLTAIIYLTSKY